MYINTTITLVVVFFFLKISIISCASYIRNGKCLDSQPYTSKIFRLVSECVEDCSVNNLCKAIVFDSASRVCNIFEQDTSVIKCVGKYLILKKDIPQDMCLKDSCPQADCGPVPKTEGPSTVYGNQVTRGSRVKYTCTDTGDVTYVTCLDNGTWSEPPSCLPPCDVLENGACTRNTTNKTQAICKCDDTTSVSHVTVPCQTIDLLTELLTLCQSSKKTTTQATQKPITQKTPTATTKTTLNATTQATLVTTTKRTPKTTGQTTPIKTTQTTPMATTKTTPMATAQTATMTTTQTTSMTTAQTAPMPTTKSSPITTPQTTSTTTKQATPNCLLNLLCANRDEKPTQVHFVEWILKTSETKYYIKYAFTEYRLSSSSEFEKFCLESYPTTASYSFSQNGQKCACAQVRFEEMKRLRPKAIANGIVGKDKIYSKDCQESREENQT